MKWKIEHVWNYQPVIYSKSKPRLISSILGYPGVSISHDQNDLSLSSENDASANSPKPAADLERELEPWLNHRKVGGMKSH